MTMKKSFLILPLVALLSACSTTKSESESTTSTPEWQTDVVQNAEMPTSMTQPTFQQPTYSVPQPVSGSYGSAQSGSTEIIGNCQVIRGYDNAPIYAQMQKGCYTANSYTTNKGDTLFLIGFLTGQGAQRIADLNGISVNTKLKTGQVLRVR